MIKDNPKYSELFVQLQDLFSSNEKVLVLGIGEVRMGDDGVGPYVSFHLSELISNPNIKFMNGGIVPVERMQELIDFKPNVLLIIDAADINTPPGDLGLFEESIMRNYLPVSSHTLPLPVFLDECKRKISGLKPYLLGIKPYSLAFLERYEMFEEDTYSLDDKEANADIPFYGFNLTENMMQMCMELVELFTEAITNL